jgi:hypothetical protein
VIANLAAATGLDPGPLTLAELAAAAEFKSMDDWNHTTAIRCDVLNSAYGRKRSVRFADIHPMRNRATAQRLSRESSYQLLDEMFSRSASA